MSGGIGNRGLVVLGFECNVGLMSLIGGVGNEETKGKWGKGRVLGDQSIIQDPTANFL